MTAIATRTPLANPTRIRIFTANVRAEWTKLWSVRSTVWTLLATIGITIGFGALVAVTHTDSWDTLDSAQQHGFDPTAFSLSGLWLAQLAVGVLGVLMATSEYATGQIRATFGATPQRLTVLAAKATTFTAVILATGALASSSTFFIGQGIFAAEGLGASITEPDVLRAVLGGALYLAGVGLLGVGLGTILRRTAGAVAGLAAVLVMAPIVGTFLPASIQEAVVRYLPAQAGMSIFTVVPDPGALAPWPGFGVLLLYVAALFAVGGVLLTRRDA